MASFVTSHSKSLLGSIRVPGDKSISHRSIMLGSIATGTTRVSGFLQGEDSLATLNAFKEMGVSIERKGSDVIIQGVGMHGLKMPKNSLNLGNSGTSIRLMSGLLSAQSFNSELCGDESLSKRPMGRVIEPLRQMGADISGPNSMPPLWINGGKTLSAIEYTLPVASAQIKSCILLAGLYSKGSTTVIENGISRDHTERMLRGFGYEVQTSDNKISIEGGGSLKACNIEVPSDISSAAFFMVAACISDDADIVLEAVNINPTRTGVIDILKLMGGHIELMNERVEAGELIADIRVRSSNLKGIQIPKKLVPLAIDEFPAIFIAACCADGETLLTGAKELRVKESDRIQVMADGLTSLGIVNHVLEDGIRIVGGKFKEQTTPIESHHDHRISMAFAIASVSSDSDIKIEGVDNVKTSFPNFVALANSIGMSITESA
ncbi:3-phosphoshikimate 1-carboxyvinyltransferase [Candidatus Pseudothioglobus singularis]|nr:3-phosphoshikimate 1-carboxyvinyltransferase [Candidatus Pseudothioglobus singularis]MDB4598651.1 3-phosphoshikimate 1-carboxyvinyltransferase [Candidatus Pseudothioglobus singularis]MDC1064969.1 3-phosphoshikimate 1-carboxyvinyltransferase [Candidatus Pseudothioglobus singularis]